MRNVRLITAYIPILLLLVADGMFQLLFPKSLPFFPEILSLFVQLIVPGLLVSFMLFREVRSFWFYLINSLGISISLIYVTSFISSFAFPLIGFDRPLDRYPYLFVSWAVIAVLFIASVIKNREAKSDLNAVFFSTTKTLIYIGCLMLSCISIAGAMYLNNGGTYLITLSWLFFLTVIFGIVSFVNNSFSTPIRPFFIFLLALSVLWMLSARSQYLIGWDIIGEAAVARTTMASGRWRLEDIENAYNACLSITVLPTVLSNVTGISVEHLYKYLFPYIFAHFPVIVYFWLKKVSTKNIAFFSSIYIIAQPFFNQSMVALARQEISFFFFALILFLIFSEVISVKKRIFLTAIYIMAMVTSHYSTSYITIIIFSSVIMSSTTIRFIRHLPLPNIIKTLTFYKNWTVNYKSSLKSWMVILLISFTYIWYFLFTQTAAHIQQLILSSLSEMTQLFTMEQKSEEVRNALPGVSNTIHTTAEDMYIYEHAFDYTLNNLTLQQIQETFNSYPLVPLSETSIPSTINPVRGNSFNKWLNYLKDGLKILLLLGAAIQLIKTAKNENQNMDLVLFSCVGAAVLSVMILHPSLGVNYNISRIYLQLLIFLGASLMVSLTTITWFVPEKIRNIAVTLILCVTLLHLQGALVPLIGGVPVLHLYQTGTDYEKFYVLKGELEAARWLQNNRNFKNAVYGDDISGLRIRNIAYFFPKNSIVPVVLKNDASSYVYLTATNKLRHKAQVNFMNKFLTYQYPSKYLQENRNQIYSNESSAIYR